MVSGDLRHAYRTAALAGDRTVRATAQLGLHVVAAEEEAHQQSVSAERVVELVIGDETRERVAHDRIAQAAQGHDPAEDFVGVEPDGALNRGIEADGSTGREQCNGIVKRGQDTGHESSPYRKRVGGAKRESWRRPRWSKLLAGKLFGAD
jgi:hypothetical protein